MSELERMRKSIAAMKKRVIAIKKDKNNTQIGNLKNAKTQEI